jgi:alkylhydroperoxidase family enzyme
MADLAKHRKAVVERVLQGDGKAPREQRAAAFANAGVAPEAVRAMIDKVARHAYKVTDEDVAAAKASGLSEDAIFEIVVAAALGQATRQYESAMAALEEASK